LASAVNTRLYNYPKESIHRLSFRISVPEESTLWGCNISIPAIKERTVQSVFQMTIVPHGSFLGLYTIFTSPKGSIIYQVSNIWTVSLLSIFEPSPLITAPHGPTLKNNPPGKGERTFARIGNKRKLKQ
jgi:hypothetical protein